MSLLFIPQAEMENQDGIARNEALEKELIAEKRTAGAIAILKADSPTLTRTLNLFANRGLFGLSDFVTDWFEGDAACYAWPAQASVHGDAARGDSMPCEIAPLCRACPVLAWFP